MRVPAIFALSCLSTVCLAATPQTDIVGSQDGSSQGSGSFKLSTFDVHETVALDTFGFYMEPQANEAQINFVVYREGFNGWDLVWDSGRSTVGQGLEFKSSGPVGYTLARDEHYGVGVFIPEGQDVEYFFGVGANGDLGWSTVSGSLWTQNGTFGAGSPPDPAFGNGSTSPGSAYHLEIRVLYGDDLDGDGVSEFDDCDDNDPTVFPGAGEACDGVDNDCDGEVDEDIVYRDVFPDLDADGYGNGSGIPINTCDAVAPSGYADAIGDCDDSRADVNPAAPEVCDGVDNDCDGMLMPDESIDADGDGAPVCVDCDDDDPETLPGLAFDECNGQDNDCDGVVPTGKDCESLDDEELVLACACDASTPGGAGAFGLIGLLALIRRRR